MATVPMRADVEIAAEPHMREMLLGERMQKLPREDHTVLGQLLWMKLAAVHASWL